MAWSGFREVAGESSLEPILGLPGGGPRPSMAGSGFRKATGERGLEASLGLGGGGLRPSMAWSVREVAGDSGVEPSLILPGYVSKQEPSRQGDAGKGRHGMSTDWLAALDDDEVLEYVNDWYDFLDELAKHQRREGSDEPAGDGNRRPDDNEDVGEDEDLSGPRHCMALPSVGGRVGQSSARGDGFAERADEYAVRDQGGAVRVAQRSVGADGCAARNDISNVHANGTNFDSGDDVHKMPVDSDAETYNGEIDGHDDIVLFVPDSLANEELADKNGDEVIDEMLKLLIPLYRPSTRSK